MFFLILVYGCFFFEFINLEWSGIKIVTRSCDISPKARLLD